MSAGSTTAKVALLRADEVEVLRTLLQLYRYDFSEFTDEDVDEGGRFRDQTDRYVSEASYTTYLIRVEGKLAGFAILQRCEAVDGRGPVTDVAQFFVLRKYRRRGVGRDVAMMLFDRYAGTWQVGERPNNVAAQAFWRRVIGAYTGGEFEELTGDAERGPTQFFVSRSGGAG
jgi:predicted acetyltransferase